MNTIDQLKQLEIRNEVNHIRDEQKIKNRGKGRKYDKEYYSKRKSTEAVITAPA